MGGGGGGFWNTAHVTHTLMVLDQLVIWNVVGVIKVLTQGRPQPQQMMQLVIGQHLQANLFACTR